MLGNDIKFTAHDYYGDPHIYTLVEEIVVLFIITFTDMYKREEHLPIEI